MHRGFRASVLALLLVLSLAMGGLSPAAALAVPATDAKLTQPGYTTQ
ncbi:MAG: hypothetical protein M3Q29_15565 [Chloroflexota bacterium]|nr:hypothetical protein [Chloroflexota bacterium]